MFTIPCKKKTNDLDIKTDPKIHEAFYRIIALCNFCYYACHGIGITAIIITAI